MKCKFFLPLTGNITGLSRLRLDYGLKLEVFSTRKIINILNLAKGEDYYYAIAHLFLNGMSSNKKKIFCITKSISNNKEEVNFEHIKLLITKLRLFKEGNIGYWNTHFFYHKRYKSKFVTSDSAFNTFFHNNVVVSYSLDGREIGVCNKFIKKIKLSDQRKLKIAIDNFNQSYSNINDELRFLSLMIAIEALYSKNSQELLSFRVTRNCSIFLGENEVDSIKIYKDMKNLYKIRSEIIHGSAGKLNHQNLLLLRMYVRKSIVKYLITSKDPNKILDNFDTLGFRDRIY